MVSWGKAERGDRVQSMPFDKTNWSDESFPLLETLSAELHDILIVTYLYCHAVSPCCAGQARCLSLIQSLIAHSIAAVPRPDAPRIISPVPLPLPPPGRPTTTRPSHLTSTSSPPSILLSYHTLSHRLRWQSLLVFERLIARVFASTDLITLFTSRISSRYPFEYIGVCFLLLSHDTAKAQSSKQYPPASKHRRKYAHTKHT